MRFKPRLHVASMSQFLDRLKWVQCSPRVLFEHKLKQGASHNGDV